MPKGVKPGKPLTKSQTAAHLAARVGISKKQATQFMLALGELARQQAKNGFTLPGIGKLVLVHRKARVYRNPQTGQEIPKPAQKLVKFRIAKAVREEILATASSR